MSTVNGFARLAVSVLWTLINAIAAILVIPFDRKGHAYHWVGRCWSRGLLIIGGVALTTHGAQYLVPGKSYIYVSNHASLFDIPILTAGIPDQLRIVYKKELEKIPLLGWGLRWGSYIGIDRGNNAEAKKSLGEAIHKIRRGASVLLYAEGTRTLDGRLQPFKRGAFNLAITSGVPVVPVTLNGTFRIMPKHSITIRPGRVELILNPPIEVGTEQGRDAEIRLMEKVHEVIAKQYVDQ